MLRAAAWTCGLFLVGGGVVQLFPGQLTEPLVLLALGTTLFLISGRSPASNRAVNAADDSETVAPTRAARLR